MSTSATTDPSAAQIGKIIEEAEEGLPRGGSLYDLEQQARLTVELMLLDSSGDPIAFAKDPSAVIVLSLLGLSFTAVSLFFQRKESIYQNFSGLRLGNGPSNRLCGEGFTECPS